MILLNIVIFQNQNRLQNLYSVIQKDGHSVTSVTCWLEVKLQLKTSFVELVICQYELLSSTGIAGIYAVQKTIESFGSLFVIAISETQKHELIALKKVSILQIPFHKNDLFNLLERTKKIFLSTQSSKTKHSYHADPDLEELVAELESNAPESAFFSLDEEDEYEKTVPLTKTLTSEIQTSLTLETTQKLNAPTRPEKQQSLDTIHELPGWARRSSSKLKTSLKAQNHDDNENIFEGLISDLPDIFSSEKETQNDSFQAMNDFLQNSFEESNQSSNTSKSEGVFSSQSQKTTHPPQIADDFHNNSSSLGESAFGRRFRQRALSQAHVAIHQKKKQKEKPLKTIEIWLPPLTEGKISDVDVVALILAPTLMKTSGILTLNQNKLVSLIQIIDGILCIPTRDQQNATAWLKATLRWTTGSYFFEQKEKQQLLLSSGHVTPIYSLLTIIEQGVRLGTNANHAYSHMSTLLSHYPVQTTLQISRENAKPIQWFIDQLSYGISFQKMVEKQADPLAILFAAYLAKVAGFVVWLEKPYHPPIHVKWRSKLKKESFMANHPPKKRPKVSRPKTSLPKRFRPKTPVKKDPQKQKLDARTKLMNLLSAFETQTLHDFLKLKADSSTELFDRSFYSILGEIHPDRFVNESSEVRSLSDVLYRKIRNSHHEFLTKRKTQAHDKAESVQQTQIPQKLPQSSTQSRIRQRVETNKEIPVEQLLLRAGRLLTAGSQIKAHHLVELARKKGAKGCKLETYSAILDYYVEHASAEEAIKRLKQAKELAKSPHQSAEIELFLGHIFRLEKRTGAQKHYQNAITYDPENNVALRWLREYAKRSRIENSETRGFLERLFGGKLK